jgi:hypothetical protein
MRAGSILTYPRQVLLRMPVTADPGRAGRGGNQFLAAFLARAHAWYAAGITIERILSDNDACYRSRNWAACAELGITHKRTRPTGP